MHKILFAVLMALVLTLAVVGVKRFAQADTVESPKVLMAEGGAPTPIPW